MWPPFMVWCRSIGFLMRLDARAVGTASKPGLLQRPAATTSAAHRGPRRARRRHPGHQPNTGACALDSFLLRPEGLPFCVDDGNPANSGIRIYRCIRREHPSDCRASLNPTPPGVDSQTSARVEHPVAADWGASGRVLRRAPGAPTGRSAARPARHRWVAQSATGEVSRSRAAAASAATEAAMSAAARASAARRSASLAAARSRSARRRRW